MTRGRKKAAAVPALEGPILEDRMFLVQCKAYLEWPRTPDPYFVRELLERYVALVNLKPISGPEIAAMVDFQAIRMPSISQAVEFVQGLLGDEFSLEAVQQSHKRYGKRADQLKAERNKRMRMMEESNASLSAISEEEWEQSRNEFEERQRKFEAYLKLQEELFPTRTHD